MNTPKKGHDMDPTRPGEDIEGSAEAVRIAEI
jgi:hypothetical protein